MAEWRHGRPDRIEVIDLLTESLRALLADGDEPAREELGEDTPLVGPDAVLTSLALVSLIVELEQTLEDRYGVCVTLADERAMSQRQSPFRTVGTLADYALGLAPEPSA